MTGNWERIVSKDSNKSPYLGSKLRLENYSIFNANFTGGYPAKDQDGNWLSSSQQPASPITNVAEAPGGYIWDKVNAAGLTYRNYGFYYSTGFPSTGPPFQIPDNYPTVKNLCPPGHIPPPLDQVAGFSDYDFRRFDFGYADSDAWVKYKLPPPT